MADKKGRSKPSVITSLLSCPLCIAFVTDLVSTAKTLPSGAIIALARFDDFTCAILNLGLTQTTSFMAAGHLAKA
jgi:hypothetical protein